jgi:hypothetical protein
MRLCKALHIVQAFFGPALSSDKWESTIHKSAAYFQAWNFTETYGAQCRVILTKPLEISFSLSFGRTRDALDPLTHLGASLFLRIDMAYLTQAQ